MTDGSEFAANCKKPGFFVGERGFANAIPRRQRELSIARALLQKMVDRPFGQFNAGQQSRKRRGKTEINSLF
jgi:hypothetical protein